MLSITEKWKLYISSYLPLYFLVLLKNYKQVCSSLRDISSPKATDILIYIIIVILLASFFMIRKVFFGSPTKSFTIEGDFEPVSDNVMSYVTTYIVPLISVDFLDPITVVTNILLFLFIGIIYVRNDLIYLNPLVSINHNIYINKNDIIISKYSSGELKRFKKENIKVTGKKLSSNIKLYQKVKQ
ncbi:hypothetical protein [Enterococcus alishanensis]